MVLPGAAREGRQRRREGGRVDHTGDTDLLQQKALLLTSRGEISRAVGRLTSYGIADLDNPDVMDQFRAKYLPGGWVMPDGVRCGQPVSNLMGLREVGSTLLSWRRFWWNRRLS